MPTASIKAISFDAGDTLVHLHPTFGEVFAETCASVGLCLSPEQQRALERFIARRLVEHQEQGQRFTISPAASRRFWQGAYRDFLAQLGADEAVLEALPPRLYDTFTDVQRYRLFDDALPVLEWLRERDVRLGIVSNWESWLDRLIGHLGLRPYFDFVVISGSFGLEKPDRRIFIEAARQAGVAVSEMLHIGDSPRQDVEGARLAGLGAILVDRHGRFPEVTPRVRTLTELIAADGLLGRLPARLRHG